MATPDWETHDDAESRRQEGPMRVLVVDDDPGYAELTAKTLAREHERIETDHETSPERALERLRAEPAVECVVSDYDMPQLNGLEFLEALRAERPSLPFILYTGKGTEEVARDAIEAGVTGYHRKEAGTEGFVLLANQIETAVSEYRARGRLRERERRHEQTLEALHAATRDLMRANSKREMYRATVETGRELLDVEHLLAYTFDPEVAALTLEVASDRTAEVLDPPETLEQDEGPIWAAFSEGAVRYTPDVREAGATRPIDRVLRSQLVVPLGTHGVLVAAAEAADGIAEPTTELTRILAANAEAALDRAEREELLREHDRTLTRQNEQLTRLNHTNEIVRGINRAISRATTRREIEETACERLAGTDRYAFAWVGTLDGDEPEVTVWSGVDGSYVDRVRADGVSAPEAALVREAIEGGDVVVRGAVLQDPDWESRRTEALTYGFQTVLAVPIGDGDRTHGALVVHAAQPDAVTEEERAVLAELGETIGHAIGSIQRTRAMLTDSRVRLELECVDERLLLNRLSERVEGGLELSGLIDREGGAVVRFVAVPADAGTAFESIADEWATVEDVSVVSTGEERVLLEISGTTTPFIETLREHDVRLRGARATAGTSELVLELPHSVPARVVVETLQEAYPETTLTARREIEAPSAPGSLDARLAEVLTSRQLEALQAAHYSGYYEWPRETTGEDLARTLEVSPPTYHYHLRAAERKLVALALGGEH